MYVPRDGRQFRSSGGVPWQAHGARSGLGHGEFLGYFDGAHARSALSLTSPRRLNRPISLPELRSTPKGFHPPQSFAYLDTETANRLLQMAEPPETGNGSRPGVWIGQERIRLPPTVTQ